MVNEQLPFKERMKKIREDKIQGIVKMLESLTDDERLDIFNHFCKDCGTPTIPCSCMRDE